MSSTLKGSRTEKNLTQAFARVSMARNRFTYYAKVAKKQGYERIGSYFSETANNEKVIAKRLIELINSNEASVRVQFAVPIFSIENTLDNLKSAADCELEEHSSIYPHMATIAEQEGFNEIAKVFRYIATIERDHELRFRTLAKQVENNTFFTRDRQVSWKCIHCGYTVRENEAPEACIACCSPQSYYELQAILE